MNPLPHYTFSLYRLKNGHEVKIFLLCQDTFCEHSGNVSDLGMTVLSRKVFYSVAAMRSSLLRQCLRLGHDDVESESLLLGRDNAFHSVSAMRSSLLRQCLRLGHDSVESKSLLVGRDNAFHSGMAKPPARP